MLQVAAKLKLELFPDDDVYISDADLNIIKGNPQVGVEFFPEVTDPE